MQCSLSTVTHPALCSSGTNIQSMSMSFLTRQAKGPLSSWSRELVAGASELWKKSHSHWKEAQGGAGPFAVLGQRWHRTAPHFCRSAHNGKVGKQWPSHRTRQYSEQDPADFKALAELLPPPTGPLGPQAGVTGQSCTQQRLQTSRRSHLLLLPTTSLLKAMVDRQQIFPSPYILRAPLEGGKKPFVPPTGS